MAALEQQLSDERAEHEVAVASSAEQVGRCQSDNLLVAMLWSVQLCT